MAPIRRYLRITKYSVLEVRIYLDDPGQADVWLLDPRRDVLPRIMKAIRPYVLPKLREENERTKGKSKKAKGVKDVVSEDDFEVAMFLTETNSRHALLTRHRIFREKSEKIRSNSNKLTSWVTSASQGETGEAEAPVTIREEEDDEDSNERGLMDFPEADADPDNGQRVKGGTKRPRDGDAEDPLFVPDELVSEDEGFEAEPSHASKKVRLEQQKQKDHDDKKKMGMTTAYDGYSIYGRILCLIIKRRGYQRRQTGAGESSERHMMENWVSTQAAAPEIQMPDD